jgi:hypothetical protein
MKALADLFSTDYGLMSVGVIAVTIFIMGFFSVWFMRKINEDTNNPRK